MSRLGELLQRLVAPGERCSQVSASECHEIVDLVAAIPYVWVAAYVEVDGQVLVRRRNQRAVCDFGMYGPPGGKVHRGESIEQALRREVFEETGCNVAAAALVVVYEDLVAGGIVFFYRVRLKERDALKTELGHEAWEWLDIQQLVSMGSEVQRGLANYLGLDTPGCRRCI